jgi:hypothetical protein
VGRAVVHRCWVMWFVPHFYRDAGRWRDEGHAGCGNVPQVGSGGPLPELVVKDVSDMVRVLFTFSGSIWLQTALSTVGVFEGVARTMVGEVGELSAPS